LVEKTSETSYQKNSTKGNREVTLHKEGGSVEVESMMGAPSGNGLTEPLPDQKRFSCTQIFSKKDLSACYLYIYILMNEYSRRRRFVRGRVQATCDNGRRREEYIKNHVQPCPKLFLVNRRTFFWKRGKTDFFFILLGGGRDEFGAGARSRSTMR